MHGIAEYFSECVWVEGFNLSSDGNEARERGSEKIERKSDFLWKCSDIVCEF